MVLGPTVEIESSPGFARAASTRSASVRYGDLLLTTSTCGESTRKQIGSKLVRGSKFTLRRSGLIIWPFELISKVLPSGAARATVSAAMIEPAPGRLSTTIVCPRVRPR